MNDNSEYIYKELCYEINGCAFEALKDVGVGFNEINYHKVFHQHLIQKGLRANYKVPLHLDYNGERIHDFDIAEIVEDKIIIEVKCIQTGFLPENYAQIITYLKLKKLRLGLLINFGLQQAYSKRVIFDEDRREDNKKWDKHFIKSIPDEKTLNTILDSISNINKLLGPGHLSQSYKKAFSIELGNRKIQCDTHACINLKVGNIQFKPFEVDYWMIDNFLLLGILAGSANPRIYDLYRMRSYLNRLNLHYGIICYWSTKNLQIYGIFEP